MKNAGKFIDFIITQKCTFNCEYCSQSKKETKNKNNASSKTINSFYNLLDKIDKDFEITLTGGEALLHPEFFEIAKKVKEKGFKINLITNLSFDIEKYKKVFKILDSALNRFDISFHIDEIKNFDNHIKKLNEIINLKPKNTKTVFLIPLYKINKEKEEKIEKIIEIAKINDIGYDFQHIHYFEKYIDNNIKPQKTFGNNCLAGCFSAVIYENGEAYRCYSSRFLKSNHLGNINDKNFSLLKCAQPCVHNFCTCPKVKNYNQILSKKSIANAHFLRILNAIFIPYYMIKNFEILKVKLRQYFKN